jgi:hypothetical protein
VKAEKGGKRKCVTYKMRAYPCEQRATPTLRKQDRKKDKGYHKFEEVSQNVA